MHKVPTNHPLILVLVLMGLMGVLVKQAYGQTGAIRGQVIDAVTQEPLPGVNVVVEGTTLGASTGLDGEFLIENLTPGAYTLRATFLGYATQRRADVMVQPSRPTFTLFELNEALVELEGVVVTASPFIVQNDAPTSVQTLDAEEIRRTPGGQNDLSRTLLSLPGVTGGVDSRNDLLVRGGGPSENGYFVDGIEIPQINHFATQGASGGALGLLNVDFIREVDFFTGGFPARYGDAASSVLVVKNRPGSREKLAGDFTIGAVETALTLDGSIGYNNNWLFSVRRSYLQLLFQLLELPIRPGYWDTQFRVEMNPTARDRITIVGLGAIDSFDIIQPDNGDIEQEEIFERVLENNQTSYTAGASWRRLVPGGFYTVALSRSVQDFSFADVDREGETVLENESIEAENRLRVDGDLRLSPLFTVGAGAGTKLSLVETDFFERAGPATNFRSDLRFSSDLSLWKSFGYTQLTSHLLGGRLNTTIGLRVDGNSFIEDKISVSPRLSTSYDITPTVTLKAATGLFTQSPEYLSLTVRDSTGGYVNRGLDYLRVNQYIAGAAWLPRPSLRLSIEGFYKYYRDTPVSVSDPRVSLANLGGGYGYIGAEPLTSNGKGRAYGAELFAQQKLLDQLYFLGAYTLAWSEFAGSDGFYRPSSWDVRHAFSLTAGYRIGQAWEIGIKWRSLSGRPFTPFDLARSAEEYARTRRGVTDLDRLNSERTPSYQRLDVRVDRRFSFPKWNAVVYVDVQNVLNRRNIFGYDYTEDPEVPNRLRAQENVGLLPNIGFSIEF